MQRAHRHDLGHPAVKMGLQKLYNTKRVRGIERRKRGRYNTNHYQEKELGAIAGRLSVLRIGKGQEVVVSIRRFHIDKFALASEP